MKSSLILSISIFLVCELALASQNAPTHITYQHSPLVLKGEVYKPNGKGPFPVVLYNHGSAPKMLNSMASSAIGPLFAEEGWVFFMPYRRGQGLSEPAGPYILDEVKKVEAELGKKASYEKLVDLLTNEHLQDQVSAFEWIKRQPFTDSNRIAVAGNSFGGILTTLGAEILPYCAAIDAAGAAQAWSKIPRLHNLMIKAAQNSQSPIFFFQAENDYDLTPSKILFSEMKKIGKIAQLKIYPTFGNSPKDGHSFPYKGASVWFPDALTFIKLYCHKK